MGGDGKTDASLQKEPKLEDYIQDSVLFFFHRCLNRSFGAHCGVSVTGVCFEVFFLPVVAKTRRVTKFRAHYLIQEYMVT